MKNLNQSIIKKLTIVTRWNGKVELSRLSYLTKAEKEDVEKKKEKYLKAVIAFQKKQKEAKQYELDKKEAQKFKLSVKKYRELQQKVNAILSNFHTGHSMGCYRYLYVNKNLFCSNSILWDYAKTCKYKPTYGTIRINLTMKQLKNIEIIEGVPTLRLPNHKCIILKGKGSKQNYFVDFHECYLIGLSHAETLQEAINLERQKRHYYAVKKLKEAAFVGVQDIKKLGACDAGIEAFCNRNGLDKNHGYRLDFLLSLNDSPQYFQRLIN